MSEPQEWPCKCTGLGAQVCPAHNEIVRREHIQMAVDQLNSDIVSLAKQMAKEGGTPDWVYHPDIGFICS